MKKILLQLLVLSSFYSVNGQDTTSYKSKKHPAYTIISSGLNTAKFRGFATSPLFYKGTVPFFQLSHLRTDNRKENEFGFSYSSGTYTNDFNNHSNRASVNSIALYYALLYQIPQLNSLKWNTRFGG